MVFVPCGTSLDYRLAVAAKTLAKLKSQKFKGVTRFPVYRTEADQVRFLLGHL